MNARKTLLLAATLLPATVALGYIAATTDAFRPSGPLERWQTLIAGVLAIAAAIITVVPVWRQLARTTVQTNSIFREFLAERLRATKRRQKWLTDRIHSFDAELSSRVYEIEEFDGGAVDPHWAFDRDQRAGRLVQELSEYQAERRDPPEVSAVLTDAISRLQAVHDTCRAIHLTSSTEQHGDDYAIPDEEWEELKKLGKNAENALPKIASSFSSAVRKLDAALNTEILSLRERILQIDRALLSSQT